LAVGQTLRVVGVLDRPSPAMNPGQFDWETYYRQDRVLADVTVPHLSGVEIIEDPGPGVIEYLREKARRLLAAGFPPERSREFALLQALVLGDRDAEMRDAQDDFAHSGAAHLLAVSGLHVVIVAAFAMMLARLLGLHPRHATWLMILVVVMYGYVVVPGAPSKRATILCVAYGVSQLTRRTGDGIQLLALCLIGLLIYHPHDLYTAGFQLSFFTVFGMLVAGRRVAVGINGWLEDEDARVARSFRPPGFWGRLGLRLRHHLVDAFSIGIVAWLCSMPLVMVHFQQINPWAIPFGILLFPFVAIALLGGLAKIVITLALPSFSATWALLAAAPIQFLRWLVHELAHLPGADLPLPDFPGHYRLIFYALLILPLLPWTWKKLRQIIRFTPAAACGLAFLHFFLGSAPRQAPDESRVTLLSVGAGQIAVVELPDRTYLIDDGSSTITEPLAKVLAPYLRTRGRSRIDGIFLSHPDYDHIGATADTVDEFHVGRVVTNPVFRAQSIGNAPAEAILQRLDDEHVPVDTAARGETLPLDDHGGAALEVLWPPPARNFLSTNNAGMVLRLRTNGHTVLFPADIQVATERELTALAHVEADVLVAPHHGSAESTTRDFIDAVKPGVIVSSNAIRLSKKQREFDRLEAGRHAYRTSTCGAITIHLPKNGQVWIESFLPLKDQAAMKR
jgi:competence protein ComEC